METMKDCKQKLEELESSMDNIVNELDLIIDDFKNTEELMSDYFTFRSRLHQEIRSIFPTGTKFQNF